MNMPTVSRNTIGISVLLAVIIALGFAASEFGRRSTISVAEQDGGGKAEQTVDAATILSELRRSPRNVYGFGGGVMSGGAALTNEEWQAAVKAVNDLRAEKARRKSVETLKSNDAWQPPEEIAGKTNKSR
ncbi:hypothetical protein [Methylocystis sp. S23]|jgi:hypothetical protein